MIFDIGMCHQNLLHSYPPDNLISQALATRTNDICPVLYDVTNLNRVSISSSTEFVLTNSPASQARHQLSQNAFILERRKLKKKATHFGAAIAHHLWRWQLCSAVAH